MEHIRTLHPVNRHIVIVPHVKQNETESGVLLPEDFVRDENEDRYITATVVSVARATLFGSIVVVIVIPAEPSMSHQY